MKRTVSIILVTIMMVLFTSCKGTIGESESIEFNQEVASSTISMLDEYYQGMCESNFDLAFKNYPNFYVKNIELELEYYGGTKDEYISKDNKDWYISNYGEDFTITAEVTDTTLMTKAVTKKYNKLIKELYREDETVENVYTVYVNKIVSGTLKSDVNSEIWTVLQIDNKYYLYDDYFEQMAYDPNQVTTDKTTVTVQ
ncbi:MAG: hypothetical protein ACI4WH_06470 [Oscillospiraceae bacterium]